MENKKMYEPSPEEIEFDIWAEKPEPREHHCYFYLSEEELQQVFDVLDTNPDACFSDIPAELYKAAEEAADELCEEYGYADTKIQKNMPDDILNLYDEHIKDMKQESDEQENAPVCLNLKVCRADMLEIAKGWKSYTIELNPDNEEIFLELDEEENEDGTVVCYKLEDEEGNTVARHFDIIRFFSGKDPEGAHVTVAVKSEKVVAAADAQGYPISYKVDGEDYLVEEVVYELGEIIEQNVNPGKNTQPIEGPAMKCLAVRQPWAQLIVTGIKDIECRESMPAPKKPKVFIAASGTKLSWNELSREVQEIYSQYEKKGVLPAYKDLPTKCIVGYVDIVKASTDPVDSPWGSDWDGMKYTLRNAMVLDEPIYGKNKATPYFYFVEGYDENHLPPAHKAEL